MEESSQGRVDEVVRVADAEIKAVREEKQRAVVALAAVQAEVQSLNSLKTHIAELSILEEKAREDARTLRFNLKELSDKKLQLENAIRASKANETKLESLVSSSSTSSERERLALANAQARAAESEAALEDAHANINDLISEIEGVAASEEQTRAQSKRLLTQMEEMRSAHVGASEENLRLLEQIAAMQQKMGALLQK